MKVFFHGTKPRIGAKCIVVLACLLAAGVANAQESDLGKSKWGVWIDFHFGANFMDGSRGFTDYMQSNYPSLDYRSAYIGWEMVGLGYGVEYRGFTLGMFLDAALGSSGAAVKNQLVKKDDRNFRLDLGYRIPLGKLFTLEPTAGFGVSMSDLFLSTSRGGADYVNSFSTVNYIVPLTVNILTDMRGGDVGIYLQYIIGVGQIGTTHITGLDTEVADLHFQPSTLTFGCKYRF
jgi:hypothetical protein